MDAKGVSGSLIYVASAQPDPYSSQYCILQPIISIVHDMGVNMGGYLAYTKPYYRTSLFNVIC